MERKGSVHFETRKTLDIGLVLHITGRVRPATARSLGPGEGQAVVLYADDLPGAAGAAERSRSRRGRPAHQGVEFLISGPPGYETEGEWSVRKEREWADLSVGWVREIIGPNSVLVAAALHRDEASPHLHVLAVPIDSKGKLRWREVRAEAAKRLGVKFQNNKQFVKDAATALQTDYAERVGKRFGLRRGDVGSGIPHELVDRAKGMQRRREIEEAKAARAKKEAEEAVEAKIRAEEETKQAKTDANREKSQADRYVDEKRSEWKRAEARRKEEEGKNARLKAIRSKKFWGRESKAEERTRLEKEALEGKLANLTKKLEEALAEVRALEGQVSASAQALGEEREKNADLEREVKSLTDIQNLLKEHRTTPEKQIARMNQDEEDRRFDFLLQIERQLLWPSPDTAPLHPLVGEDLYQKIRPCVIEMMEGYRARLIASVYDRCVPPHLVERRRALAEQGAGASARGVADRGR